MNVFAEDFPYNVFFYLLISMNQEITHADDLLPRCSRVCQAEIFCQEIGCLSNNHEIIYNGMVSHDI